MEDKNYQQYIIEIRIILDNHHNAYKNKVMDTLFKFSKILAKMSDQQIHDLINIHLKDRATENQIQRARLYGKGLLPEHIAKEEAFIKGMPDPYCYTKMPKESRQQLSNPNNMIPITEHNAIIDVSVSEMTEERVRKIYSARNPEEGILPPDRQNAPRPYTPTYAKLIGEPKITGDDIILSFEYGRGIFKAKIPIQKLTEILEKV